MALARLEQEPELTGVVDVNFEDLKTFLLSVEASQCSAADVERDLERKGRELMRLLYQMHIDSRGSGEALAPVVDAEGVERTETRRHLRALETIFGTVSVERTGYAEPGLSSLHPLDAELNLPDEKYSLEVRHRVAREAATRSFEETIDAVAASTGAKVPKRQAEELVQRAAVDFDAFYSERSLEALQAEATGDLLILTFDQKGVFVQEQDLREGMREKLKKQRARGEEPRGRMKRMATVAAVYTVAPQVRSAEDIGRQLGPLQRKRETQPPPRPENKRVWASVSQSPEEIIRAAFEEADKRDPERQKTWAVLVDGSHELLRLIHKAGRSFSFRIVVDLLHVLGYVRKAAKVLASEDVSPEQWTWIRLQRLLHGEASQVAAGMRRSATARGLEDEVRRPVDAAARYILNHKNYLRYHLYLEAGLPIATGVIEGACRHLVGDRMELAGAEWRLPGADAVLRLRALRCSNDLETYWRFHEQRELARTHEARYNRKELPETRHPKRSRSRFQIVKDN